MDPSITSIVFDKASYNVGDTVTATVTYVPGQSVTANTQTFTGVATDSVTQAKGQLVVNFIVNTLSPDATVVTATDSAGRTWTKTSDTGTVAVFTAVA